MRHLAILAGATLLSACGAIYQSPTVSDDGARVRVIALTGESVLLANRSPYVPQTLPAIFSQTTGPGGGLRGAGALPEPVSAGSAPGGIVATRLPNAVNPGPYMIGAGDVLTLDIPGATNGDRQRGDFRVQGDGTINVVGLGRIAVAGQTIQQAEAALFQRLVDNQIDPAFTVEIAEYNSQQVTVGGAVRNPGTLPVGQAALDLNQALGAVGGPVTTSPGLVTVRLYRDGQLYQMPLEQAYGADGVGIRLVSGDSVFVDSSSDLDQAQAYFGEQIRIAELRQSSRQASLQELNTEINIRRSELNEARGNYQVRLDLDAVDRDYVYLTGEVGNQSRFVLPFGRSASLADALFSDGKGIPTETGNVAEIYVLRGSSDPREFGAVTAWHLDARNAAAIVLATGFELRPDDVIFVAEQPVTRWSRVIRQITPSLISTTVAATGN